MLILLDELQAMARTEVLSTGAALYMSAGTLAGALVVADRRGCNQERRRLIDGLVDGLGFKIVSITPASARLVADAYARWGEGIEPAGLNFGGCAHALASKTGSSLLYVGGDFPATDLHSTIPPRKSDDVPESTSQST